MPSEDALSPPPGARLTLTTLGDAALYASASSSSDRERVLNVGKPFALLVFLACSPRRLQTREFLAELLWADMEREKAQNAVRQAIWNLKTRVGDGILDATRDRVSLAEQIDVDRNALLDALNRGAFEEVVTLYRGDFLPDFATPGGQRFEEWAALERMTLRSVAVRSAHEVVRSRLEKGAAYEASAIARRFRDIDRLNQATWRDVLECLIAAGDRVGALVEADALEQLLDAEGIESTPATTTLVRTARAASNRQKSALATTTDSSRDTTSRGLVAQLVGREKEFATIMRAWDQATTGRTVHLHLSASAGLGKTRLLVDVGNRLRGAGRRVVFVHADHGTREIPYAFASDVAAALAALRGGRAVSPAAAGALVALNPSLSSSYSAERDSSTDDEALRRRALALRELVAAVADEQPLALLLDDLHWADAESFLVLSAALGQIETSRVLVVSTSRPGGERGAPSRGMMLELEPLTEEAVGAMAASLADLPAEPWARLFPRKLRDATGGSPLLILETLSLLSERGLLAVTGAHWTTNAPEELFAELSAGSALRHRIASLAQREALVALFLAVAGVPIEAARLATALGSASSNVDAAVASLERRGLLVRQGNLLRLAHDEYAATALEIASPDSARSASSALGRALIDDHAPDCGRLRLAGQLLVRGGDEQTLMRAFSLFARTQRRDGDFRGGIALAREFIGRSAAPELLSSLARILPLRDRLGFASPRKLVVLAAALFVLTTTTAGAIAWGRAHPNVAPDAVLVAMWLPGGGSGVDMIDLPIREATWGATTNIDVDLGRRPRWHLASSAVNPAGVRPDGRGWTTWRASPNGHGISLVDDDLHGRERRLTQSEHDDEAPSWAPDQTRLVFVTTRWTTKGRLNLAIYDTVTRSVRQLTSGDDQDLNPVWSPDGSRIVFRRDFWNGGSALCLIDSDAVGLRCAAIAAGAVRIVVGWADAHRVIAVVGPDTAAQLVAHNVDSNDEEILERRIFVNGATLSPDGRWIAARRSASKKSAWVVFATDRPTDFKPVNFRGTPPSQLQLGWSPTSSHPPFIARIHIQPGIGPAFVGWEYQLRAVASDSMGRSVDAGSIRWRSLDTTIATIDTSGMVDPRRAGHAKIVVSAGGWRADTIDLPVTKPMPATLFEEDWSNGIGPAWISFGDPRPKVAGGTPVGTAFLNNGDDSFFSGAYMSRAIDASRGVWFEADISVRITGAHWDDLNVALFQMADPARFAAWDRRTGDRPGGNVTCRIYFPSSGGAFFGDSLEVGSVDGGQEFSVNRSMRDGAPAHVVIQILPDGRCISMIDGRVLRVDKRVSFQATPRGTTPLVHLVLEGRSAGNQVFVGRVRVGSGIAAALLHH
jgi:DNA-binding SARP family transcriptional activator